MKITGDIGDIKRFVTGMYSFDRAFEDAETHDIGLPYGIVIEMFGFTGCGKSTTTYSIGSMLAKHLKGDMAVIDYEEFDRKHLTRILNGTGFDGELSYIDEDTDEEMMDTLLHKMADKKANFVIGFIDGVGAISTVSEQEGATGEANMGRRAKILAQLSRKSRRIRRNSGMTKTFFMTNHIHPIIGGRGMVAPGGETKNFMAKVRIRVKKKETFSDGSYVLEGKVIKNSFGYENRIFYLFVLSGRGVHVGITNMYDCILAGKAVRGKGPKVKINDQVYKFSTLIEEAKAGNNEPFEAFKNALLGDAAAPTHIVPETYTGADDDYSAEDSIFPGIDSSDEEDN